MFKGFLRKFLPAILVFVMVLTIVPLAGFAAEKEDETVKALVVKNMDVSIMPEYDDPRVLVVNQGVLVNNSSQPLTGNISFNIPKNAEIGMACELINGNQHSCQPYQKEDKGDYDRIYWKITKTLQPGEEYPVFMEYYYTPAQGYSEPDKKFQFDLSPYYETEQFNASVTQPLKATNFSTSPASLQSGQNGEGMNAASFSFSKKAAGENTPLTISYTKTDPKPSKEKPKEPGAAPSQDGSAAPAFGGLGQPQVLIPVLIFVLILAGMIVYIMSKKQPSTPYRPMGSKGKSGSPTKANNRNQANSNGKAKEGTFGKERQKARQMLLAGKITEETYLEIIAELDDEEDK